MYHIFVDLEMNETGRKYKNIKNGLKLEVIEFGAVVLDDELHEVDSYKNYVKPVFSDHINPKIVQLTGITDSMVLTAKSFDVVLEDFCAWCAKYGSDTLIYEWSNCDMLQLQREARKKNIELSHKAVTILQNWCDVQALYGIKTDTDTQIALETAIWTFGEKFAGRAHDAVNDARNTAAIYKLLQNENDVAMARQMLHHGTKETSISFTLGDIFDFSKLRLAVV